MPKKKVEKGLNGQVDHSQKAYNGIRRLLYQKQLVPGQKIAYRELAERLEMSPTPIIQALKWLEFQGFVRHEPNRGYFMEPFSLQEVEEIYRLRELLEPSLLTETIKRLNKSGIKKLEKALRAHLSAEREFYLKERLFKNVEFHITLASLSKQTTQIRVLRNLFDVLFLKYGGNYISSTSLESGDREHKEIFESVVAGDSKKARSILTHHIVNVRKQVISSFKRILREDEIPGF